MKSGTLHVVLRTPPSYTYTGMRCKITNMKSALSASLDCRWLSTYTSVYMDQPHTKRSSTSLIRVSAASNVFLTLFVIAAAALGGGQVGVELPEVRDLVRP